MSERRQTIDPLMYGEFVFEISSSLNEDMNHTCSGECPFEACVGYIMQHTKDVVHTCSTLLKGTVQLAC